MALFGLLPHAFAEVLVVDPGQQTRVTQSSAGVPVVEIADPNSKGLSHNRFQEFNVGQQGLIFNNSMRDGTSQIGGQVMHNTNLTNEARAILTEVTGNNPSTLAGTLEVFGGRADVLIAKPPIQPSKPQSDGLARHMSAATTGSTLKNALAKLNSPDRADQADLKKNPLDVRVYDKDSSVPTIYKVSDAESLKALHGKQVVTGEQAQGIKPTGSSLGRSSSLYIKVVPQPGGGFTTMLTPIKPAPLE